MPDASGNELLDPKQVAAAFDALADGYDATFTRPEARAEDTFVFSHLRARGFTDGSLIDLGCGTGLLLEHLDLSPDDYLGVDVSPGMLERAREISRPPLRVRGYV